VDVAARFEGTVVHGDDSKTRAGAEWLSLCVEDLDGDVAQGAGVYRQLGPLEGERLGGNGPASRAPIEGGEAVQTHGGQTDAVGRDLPIGEQAPSAVTSGAGEDVPVTTLDLAVAEPVSLIKMDLEGWEMKALAGGERHIRQDRPKLAIAVYHSASDFRDVWRYARSIHPDYKVYLRHYTQGWSETVMFFV